MKNIFIKISNQHNAANFFKRFQIEQWRLRHNRLKITSTMLHAGGLPQSKAASPFTAKTKLLCTMAGVPFFQRKTEPYNAKVMYRMPGKILCKLTSLRSKRAKETLFYERSDTKFFNNILNTRSSE